MKAINNYKIELQNFSSEYNLEFLRSFYTPLIKSMPISLYEYFLDKSSYSDYRGWFTIKSILSNLGCTIVEFDNARKLLEALGLLTTYQSNLKESYIFTLIKPLSLFRFRKNQILTKKLVKAIGDVEFEQLTLNFTPIKHNKEEFIDISCKYVDLFSITPKTNSYLTQEINLQKEFSIDDAINNLTPVLFIKFLTKFRANSFQKQIIKKLQQNYMNRSLNLILNYCFNVTNGKINAKYVEKIANDLFYEKDIKVFEDIKIHLENAIESKNSFNTVKNEKFVYDDFSLVGQSKKEYNVSIFDKLSKEFS